MHPRPPRMRQQATRGCPRPSKRAANRLRPAARDATTRHDTPQPIGPRARSIVTLTRLRPREQRPSAHRHLATRTQRPRAATERRGRGAPLRSSVVSVLLALSAPASSAAPWSPMFVLTVQARDEPHHVTFAIAPPYLLGRCLLCACGRQWSAPHGAHHSGHMPALRLGFANACIAYPYLSPWRPRASCARPRRLLGGAWRS